MNHVKRLIVAFFTFGVLFGCSSLPEQITSVEWQSHQQQLQKITQYQVSGKLGYISPQQRQSLNFFWQKQQDSSQLRLSTFLGQTVLNLSITPQGATAETYDDQVLSAVNVDALVYQLTGLEIPIEQLQYWLLGLPNQADSYQLNDSNTLAFLDKTIAATPWHLDYQQYQFQQFADQTIPLPSKMKLKQANTSLNIVISKWILTP
ncbi:lipoprotein localization protein LolB [Vibrio aestuarianus]|uniref:lipoprotein insertase outer membrane protein LolB n=1 Tax=Vibrio aestuarianus TaxID=28171 RepID=UPI00155984B1|nr:lipoprotein insertase outer membrane protein LolB [Vibrio aestuarianus]NGZ13266.1 lipoprotein localization protein LolB [Vibrio aestuarianus]NKZ49414.1 lipoprotein localization protein LolB [Vibrio aestuarianus]